MDADGVKMLVIGGEGLIGSHAMEIDNKDLSFGDISTEK